MVSDTGISLLKANAIDISNIYSPSYPKHSLRSRGTLSAGSYNEAKPLQLRPPTI
jgi:hypothetical protein